MSTHDTLVAEFTDAHAGREAVIELERRGAVDADRIELEGTADPRAESTRRESDARTGRFVARRTIIGGAVGAVVGAALGAGITYLLDMESQPAAAIGAAVAFGLFLSALAAYWTVAAGLPVTEGVIEAVEPPADGPVRVVIHLEEGSDEALLRPHLEEIGAVDVERVSR
jgi:hypothetical protein